MAFKIWVMVCGETKAATNAMLYETEEEAVIAGNDLLGRWMAAVSFEVKEASEEEERSGTFGSSGRKA
jgi:hypothetical protein